MLTHRLTRLGVWVTAVGSAGEIAVTVDDAAPVTIATGDESVSPHDFCEDFSGRWWLTVGLSTGLARWWSDDGGASWTRLEG
jgi:hypothetical protein